MPKQMANDESRTEVLRIPVDGDWTADDMAMFYRACDDLYNFHVFFESGFYDLQRIEFHDVVLNIRPSRAAPWWMFGPFDSWAVGVNSADDCLSRISAYLGDIQSSGRWSVPSLQVTKVRYGSEGFKDLSGIGEALRQLKELVFGIIEYVGWSRKALLEEQSLALRNEDQQKGIEQHELENKKRRLELVDQQVAILLKLGVSKKEIRQAFLGIDNRAEVFEKLALKGNLLLPSEASEKYSDKDDDKPKPSSRRKNK